MKTLLYTTAFGSDVYVEMAREMVFSARKHGYAGEIVVLSDQDVEVETADVCIVSGGLPKAGIMTARDVSKYDYVAHVDGDCVFNGELDWMFQHPDKVLLAVEESSDRRDFNESLGLTVKQEIPTINTGIVVIPGIMAEAVLTEWGKRWEVAKREKARASNPRWVAAIFDQPVMASMLSDGIPFHCADVMGFPLINGSEKKISHFCGAFNEGKTSAEQNKRIALGLMKSVNGRYNKDTLLYTICFGDKEIHYRMAEEMIWSARREGYKGHIVVLSDRKWMFPGAAKTIIVPKVSGELYKTKIRDHLNLSAFKYVLYCDTDIIWTLNPEKMMKGDKLRVARGPTLLHSAPATNAMMMDYEKAYAKEHLTHGINTGTVCLPGEQAEDILEKWEEGWASFDKSKLSDPWAGKAPDHQLYDEAALWVLILRGELEAEVMPKEEVFFPVMHASPIIRGNFGYENPDFDHRAVCCHFVATSMHTNQNAILEVMRKTTATAVPAIVEHLKSMMGGVPGGDRLARIEAKLDKQNQLLEALGNVVRALHDQMENPHENAF